MRPITILLAEDHTMVREGLRRLLERDTQFQIVGEAHNGRQAVEMVQTLRPALVLLDIAMPLMNGLEAARQIRLTVPECRILILSAHSDDAYVEQAIACGVAGFLPKQSSANNLTKAILEIDKGHTYFSPAITRRFLDHAFSAKNGSLKKKLAPLTSRENEVLQLVAEGHSNKGMAAHLGICIKTIEKHREHLMHKLDIHDTAGLTRHAISAGIIENSVQLTIV